MVEGTSEKLKRKQVLLSPEQIDFIAKLSNRTGISFSAFLRLCINKEMKLAQEAALREAAEMLARLYETDAELTTFTDLDGEEFYEAE
jgi:hypothetical protein